MLTSQLPSRFMRCIINCDINTSVAKSIMTSSTGHWFNINMLSYQYRKSHCGDKAILRSPYLHSGIFYTGKTTFLHWIGAQNANTPSVDVWKSFLFVIYVLLMSCKKWYDDCAVVMDPLCMHSLAGCFGINTPRCSLASWEITIRMTLSSRQPLRHSLFIHSLISKCWFSQSLLPIFRTHCSMENGHEMTAQVSLRPEADGAQKAR